MSMWGSARERRGRGRWRWVALVAVAVACVLRVPTGERRERTAYPGVRAARLAHLLADFTAHPHGAGAGAGAGAGGWRVVEERGNYTWWWYRVRFACGARCAGEASVAAGAPAPDHHLVTQRVTLCTHLPLLPWLSYCDEVEVESAVRAGAGAGAGGSVVEEAARARCVAARVLAGVCASVLAEHRAEHRASLAAALAARL